MRVALHFFAAAALIAAPPTLTELSPRGAQKGRPFTLTLTGTNLEDGARVLSTLNAAFTALSPDKKGPEGRYATYLVEPRGELEVGVYPIRVKTASGLSNILLFSIGAFPEIAEEESQMGALPNSNDSIEKAQPLPVSSITLNGTLKGPERDMYRIQVKANERRIFEVDARRAGSAIDPVIRVLDAAGTQVARSEDGEMLSLDPRLDVTFPIAGYYYIEITDARFSAQAQNFYRLKTGAYTYPTEVFPLGGQKGQIADVNLGVAKIKADLTAVKGPQTFVNLPDSPVLPLAFAAGENPETSEPVAGKLALPITVNGRLAKASEIDSYDLDVTPGAEYLFELQARELGTSKLMGVISIYDGAGKRLASAGDGPLPVDVFAVQASSRTSGDPFLYFKAPEGVNKVKVTVEDLALRGGTHYAYRLHAKQAPHDLQAAVSAPYLNIPAGGTMVVNVSIERRGYLGPLEVKALDLPNGVTVSGGHIAPDPPDTLNPRLSVRTALLSITAARDSDLQLDQLAFAAVGKDESGKPFVRRARGTGYAIGVAGATSQGVVDRQRALTGEWLNLGLPAAISSQPPATLALTLEKTEKKENGYEFLFRWKWNIRNEMIRPPESVSVSVPNFIDLRVINMALDKGTRETGTFTVTSTRNTLPSVYDIGLTGRLMSEGVTTEIYSEVKQFTLPALDPEEKSNNASTTPAR